MWTRYGIDMFLRFNTSDVESYSTLCLAIVGLVGAIYVPIQISVAKKSQQVENLQKLVEWFDGPIYILTRKELALKRLKQIHGDQPLSYEGAPSQAWRVLDFFEHVAWLAEKNYVSYEDVWNPFYDSVTRVYADLEVLIQVERKIQDDKTIYASLDSLIQKMRNMNHKQGGSDKPPGKELIEGYYKTESDLDTSLIYTLNVPRDTLDV